MVHSEKYCDRIGARQIRDRTRRSMYTAVKQVTSSDMKRGIPCWL